MSTVDQIVARLDAANEAYRKGTPIMSDAAFDALEEQLRGINPNHPYFGKVGAAPATTRWAKVPHKIPMGSLDKTVRETFTGWWPGSPVCITHKLDGISCGLHYDKQGKLVRAVTRGDGLVGEDITTNVVQMEGVVRQLPPEVADKEVWIRGEIVCRRSTFDQHFQGESNPRNTAAGTSKGSSPKVKYLTFIAYQVLLDGVALSTKVKELETLDQWGFLTPPYHLAANPPAVLGVFDLYVAKQRAALDWEIDGLVVEVTDRDTREGLGEHNLRPRGATALKFPHASATTRLAAVEWQVGPSGRITPVAIFDEVNLGGARCTRASLHNFDYMTQLAQDAGQEQLAIGDAIEVERRNDVIPGVASVINPADTDDDEDLIKPPTHCPACNAATSWDGAYLVCTNLDCGAQQIGAIVRWLEKIGVKHFGTALVKLLVETGKVQSIPDLYALDPADVEQMEFPDLRRVGGVATRAFKSLHDRRELTLPELLGSLGIPLCGRSTVKEIVDAGYDSLQKITKASVKDIAAIPGMGEKRATAFVDGFWDRLETICQLIVFITIRGRPQGGALAGCSVCFTGFRDRDLEQQVEAAGGVMKSSVSKGLTYLVMKTPSTSAKTVKAQQLGVVILSIDELKAKL